MRGQSSGRVARVKDLCAVLGTQGTEIFLSGCPTGKIGDQDDRTEPYVLLNFYVPFLPLSYCLVTIGVEKMIYI